MNNFQIYGAANKNISQHLFSQVGSLIKFVVDLSLEHDISINNFNTLKQNSIKMKSLTRTCFTVLCILMMGISLSSCGKDACYECLGFDDGTVSLDDLGTVCEGEMGDDGQEITAESLETLVNLYEAFGGTCTKK